MKLVGKVYASHKSAKKAFNDMWKDLLELPHDLIKNETMLEITSDDVTFRFMSEDRIENLRGVQFDTVIINETISDYTLNAVLKPTVVPSNGKIK